MNFIKNFIKTIFPPQQKFLNSIKLLYLFLFIICISEMFKYGSGEIAGAFWESVAYVLHILLFFVSIPLLLTLYDSKNRVLFFSVSIPILIIQVFLYFYSARTGLYVSVLLSPIHVLPPLITFMFITKKSQHFGRNIIIFLFIPFLIVSVDKLITFGFQVTCPFTTPKAEYSPIYLPRQFFHEEYINGKNTLVPNIEEIKELPMYYEYTIPNVKNAIFIYERCGWTREDIAKKLIENGNIVICKQKHEDSMIYNYRYIEKSIGTPILTIKKVNTDGKNSIIATLYSQESTRKYVKLVIKRPKGSYCGFGDIFSTENTQFRKNELSYDNYIKPIKELDINTLASNQAQD